MVERPEESLRLTASRRRVLQVCGGLAAVGLAGCSQSSSDPATASPTDSPTATATDTPTPTASPSPTPIQQPYRVDLQPANEAYADMAMFQYSTGRGWDDMVVDLEGLDEWHENDWDRYSKEKFQRFLDSLESGGISDEDPYWPYPNGSDESYGKYKPSEWLNAESFDTAMEWWMPAYLEYQYNVLNGISSTDQYEMAPALERSYEQLKGWELHAWAFNAPTTDEPGNHGQVLARDHQGQLWMVNTTTNWVRRPDSSDWADDWWHPLRYRGEAPDVDRVDYEKAKEKAVNVLFPMVSQDFEGPEESAGDNRFAVSDQYLDSVLTVMRSGSLPTRIYQQLKVPAYFVAAEQHFDMILYGTIDDPRYVVGPKPDLADLIEAIDTTEETYTIDDVESRLDVGS